MHDAQHVFGSNWRTNTLPVYTYRYLTNGILA